MLTSCWQEPEYAADYERHIISNLTQTPGDEEVTLAWEMAEGFSPVEYQVSYNDENGNTVQLRTGSSACTYLVENLKNDVNYVFSVQAVYKGDALSGIVKVTSTPVTSRFPVTGFTLTPGDKKIDASWTLPEGNVTSMTIVLTPSDGSAPVEISLDKAATSYSFTSLNNFLEYGVSLVVNYAKGPSEPVSGNATPMSGAPLCSVLYDNVFYGQENTFTFNSTDYPGATDIKWTFPDGVVLTGETATHKIWGIGDVAINVKCKINNIDVNYNVYVTAREFMTSYNDWPNKNIKFKNNVFAFAPDGKTVYNISYNQNRYLVAFSLETGALKWLFDLGASAAGNGAAISVNPATGDILASDNTTLYCIKDEGTKCSTKWTCATGLTVGVGAAYSPDGKTIYVGANSKKLYCLNAETGAVHSCITTLSHNVGAIIVDNTTLFVTTRGTSDNVLFIDVSNPAKMDITKKITVATGATDITSASVAPDKKTIYFSTLQYFHCADLSTQTVKKSVKVSDVANYLTCGSVVDKSGNVCVLYAESASQSQMALFAPGLESVKWRWAPESHKNTFNYNGPTLDSDGNFIAIDKNGKVWSVAPDGSPTMLFDGGNSVQGSAGMCGNAVFASYNVAPGLILGKCIKAERASGWSGPGGDPCCSKCIQWAFK